jgi:hypothetical protein
MLKQTELRETRMLPAIKYFSKKRAHLTDISQITSQVSAIL